jgi:cell wall-associated NlpC family hydrolase
VTLHTDFPYRRRGWRTVAGAAIVAVLAIAPPALGASSGGTGAGETSTGTGDTTAGGGTADSPTAPGPAAQLLENGDAAPPAGAPPEVVRAIQFANRINEKPYIYGGGHKGWRPLDKGYDCSGSVSYMLHGARIIDSPLPSGDLARWGAPGEGQWISVYANGGHAYAVVAGLRWDTSGGKGPRWHEDMRSPAGYKIRHWEGL